jgi:tetratricopeptide (TPR) repeat protein
MSDIPNLIAEAQRAEQATLWDEAVAAYERCLSEGDLSPSQQAPLLFALGRCYRNLAEARTAWRNLMRSIALFREAGDAPSMAAATVEALRIWAPHERQRALAEEALAALGPGESRSHVSLLFALEREEEARAIAVRRGYADVEAGERMWDGRHLVAAGRIEEYITLARAAQKASDAACDYDRASGALRGTGYSVLAAGRLDEGVALARESMAYARSKHLRFPEQLAALDVVGVLFARGQLDECAALLDDIPGDLDFRKDLFRCWIAERRGDVDSAIALLPDPERAGGAYGALSQVHSGRAGVMFRAGRERAAAHELAAYADAARKDGRILDDAPAMLECLVALADEDLMKAVLADERPHNWAQDATHERYSTLQGRGLDAVRGAAAARLGLHDEARAHYERGLAWAREQRCPYDEALCAQALAELSKS